MNFLLSLFVSLNLTKYITKNKLCQRSAKVVYQRRIKLSGQIDKPGVCCPFIVFKTYNRTGYEYYL